MILPDGYVVEIGPNLLTVLLQLFTLLGVVIAAYRSHRNGRVLDGWKDAHDEAVRTYAPNAKIGPGRTSTEEEAAQGDHS